MYEPPLLAADCIINELNSPELHSNVSSRDAQCREFALVQTHLSVHLTILFTQHVCILYPAPPVPRHLQSPRKGEGATMMTTDSQLVSSLSWRLMAATPTADTERLHNLRAGTPKGTIIRGRYDAAPFARKTRSDKVRGSL